LARDVFRYGSTSDMTRQCISRGTSAIGGAARITMGGQLVIYGWLAVEAEVAEVSHFSNCSPRLIPCH